jgi:hypothetical protein
MSDDTWQVYTPNEPVLFVDGQTTYFGGDLSVVLKDGRRATLTLVALYHMPFGLTVTCANCPLAP